MNKADLAASIATEASLSDADADAAVRAVFSTIADALAHAGPSGAPDSAPSRPERARPAGAAIPAPERPSPLPPRPRLRSRPARPFAMPSPDRFTKPAATFASDRRRRELVERSHVRTHAQSRAEVECPARARSLYGPNTGRRELPTTTAPRAGAHA